MNGNVYFFTTLAGEGCHSFALFRLTTMPGTEITNDYIEADQVFGQEVHIVNECFLHSRQN